MCRLHCGHTQSMGVDEDSDQILDLQLRWICQVGGLTFYLIETPFNAFANRANLDQAALVRASSTLYLIQTPFNAFANRANPDEAALVRASSTIYLIETPFNAFANRSNPDQAVLVRAA